ncbi:hypothetical protein ACFQXA_38580 [Nocardiopsis composta]
MLFRKTSGRKSAAPAESPEAAPTPAGEDAVEAAAPETLAAPEAPVAAEQPRPGPGPTAHPEPDRGPAAPAGAALTPTRVMLAIAGVLTLLSMVWTGWSVYDLLQQVAPKSPKTVAVAVAVAVELAWVAIVAVEWQHIHRSGAAPKGLVYTGWAIAATVVGVLALHAVKMESYYLLPLAALPLAGKALWSWALEDVAQAVRDRLEAARRAREKAAEEARAEEEKVAAEAAEEAARTERLSSGLTEAQEAELAEIRRRAAYITARSAAERSWTRRKRPPRPSGPRPSTPGAWTRCGAAPRSRCAPMRSTPRSCGAATSWPGSWSCRAPRCSPCRWAGRPTTPPGWRAPPAAPGAPDGLRRGLRPGAGPAGAHRR